VRNRLETRRDGPFGVATVPFVDLRARLSLWPEEIGPYGKRGPGNLAAQLEADLIPQRLVVRGEGIYDLGTGTLEHGSIGARTSPWRDFSIAGGIRHVNDDATSLWADAYLRWTDKWGGRLSWVRDIESKQTNRVQFSILRYSPDHLWELGASVRDDGEDIGLFLDFVPAIGGVPTSRPFDPREEFEYGP
jgi:hypothetical protein